MDAANAAGLGAFARGLRARERAEVLDDAFVGMLRAPLRVTGKGTPVVVMDDR
jgi:hypothetical protein